MKRFRRTIGLGSVVAMMFFGTALVGTASAANPGCGDEITTNTTLTADVGPCNDGDGLVVTASNITLNLNGHKVFSDAPLPRMTCGVPNPVPPPATICVPDDVVGIYLNDVSNVTVRNGTVHNFAAGVVIDFGGGNRVTGITARDNQGGCFDEVFTTQNPGTFGDGIAVFSSANNRIERNQTLRNGPFSGISLVANTEAVNRIVGPHPTGNQVIGNIVEDNRNCFADIGIRIEGPGASNNVVQGNRVARSFQEGIGIAAVNNINFSGLFATPPTCQNRGVPNPSLPQCPGFTGAAKTPSNDNNIISNNQVIANGFGGQQNPPSTLIAANQSASGIAMISFCQGTQALGAFTVNGAGNVIQGNSSTLNAGSGIEVGGCPPTNLPQFPPAPGFHNSKIVNNLSARNNRAQCGTLPPTPGCGTRPTTGEFDLLDTSNATVCPSATGAIQSICSTLGFPAPPPAPTPFIGTRVVVPGYPACDANLWRNNSYVTAFPPCATGNTASSAAQSSVRAASAAEAAGSGDVDQEGARPLRASSKRH